MRRSRWTPRESLRRGSGGGSPEKHRKRDRPARAQPVGSNDPGRRTGARTRTGGNKNRRTRGRYGGGIVFSVVVGGCGVHAAHCGSRLVCCCRCLWCACGSFGGAFGLLLSVIVVDVLLAGGHVDCRCSERGTLGDAAVRVVQQRARAIGGICKTRHSVWDQRVTLGTTRPARFLSACCAYTAVPGLIVQSGTKEKLFKRQGRPSFWAYIAVSGIRYLV